MAVNSIFAHIGRRSVIDITYPAAQETLLGTPLTLPTSEPGTPQVQYTVQASDLPSPIFPQQTLIAYVYAAGKAITAATVSYRMKKNGGSVATGGTAVSANNFFTRSCPFLDVAVGDVLEIALWSNQTDSNYDYKAMACKVTRVSPYAKTCTLKNVAITAGLTQDLTLGNPFRNTANQLIEYYHNNLVFGSQTTSLSSQSYLTAAVGNGIFKIDFGDISSANTGININNNSLRPNYRMPYSPTQLIFRKVTAR